MGVGPCAARVVRPTKGSAQRRGNRPCAARGCPTKGSTQRRGNHAPRAWCAGFARAVEAIPAPRVVRPTKGSARRRGSRPCAARGAPVNRRRCGDVFGGGADEGFRPAPSVPAPRVARPSTGEDAAAFSAEGPMKMSLRRARGAPVNRRSGNAARRKGMKMSLRCARGAPHQGFRPAPWKPSLRRAWRAPPRVLPSAVETIPALRAWCAPTKGSAQRRGNRSCAARGRRQPAKMRRRFRRRGR